MPIYVSPAGWVVLYSARRLSVKQSSKSFSWAWKAGRKPAKMEEITIVGESLASVKRIFKRPNVVPYTMLDNWYGPPCKNG